MELPLYEDTDGSLDWLVLRRAEANFVTPLLEVALVDVELLRIDGLPAVADPITARAERTIIEFRVVAVVRNRVRVPLHVGARVHEIEIAELAFDGEGGLHERVIGALRTEMDEIQIAHRGVVAEEARGGKRLAHDGGRHGPVVA